MLRTLFSAIALTLSIATFTTTALSQKLTVEAVNEARWEGRGASTATMLKIQVLLDRAHASPGTIDGKIGTNTRRAIAAFREMSGEGEQGGEKIDEQLWQALTGQDTEPVLIRHVISDADVEGPFLKEVPTDFREMAKLDHMGFTSVQEKLAERFHMSEELIRELNPDAEFDRPGTEIVVANVMRRELPGKVVRLEVRQEQVRAFDKDDRILAIYPATIGSQERPSPTGEFKVTAIADNPVFYYDPALNLQNVEAQEKLELAPGPNNPVGSVWISISAKGYGIHGTPHPDEVGKSASHGCIRLTNWDARELARHVNKATAVAITGTTAAR